VPAVASTAIKDMLTGQPRPATVLGTERHAVWLRTDDDVVVATTADATRLPNSIEIGRPSSAGVFAHIEHGTTATIGSRGIVFDSIAIDAVRWWNPRPALPDVSRAALEATVASLSPTVPGVDPSELTDALADRSAGGLLRAAGHLLGSGPGLTPEGDDYLAGAISGTRILATALGDHAAVTMLEVATAPLVALAHARTTTFSAALIGHAAQGRVARPAGAFLMSLAGRGDVEDSWNALTAVGHTSGPALAAGIVLAARILIHANSRTNGGIQ
jgi:hypothetical protein